jgi:serine-type D-Ala-D-Ala carboxypeptidase (penicillin-binding protein 5/6)
MTPRRDHSSSTRRTAWIGLLVALALACCSAALASTFSGDAGKGEHVRRGPAPLAPPARDCDRHLQSGAFVIADSRGRTLAALKADRPRAVGSITKLMTARLALRAGRLSETVTVPSLRLAPDESRAGLVPGERLDRNALLRFLLVPSANDAAETLAATSEHGRAAFVRAMNRSGRRLGLTHTHYANPSGMPDPAQRSSARDSVQLARLLMADRRVRRIVRMRGVEAPGADGARLASTNTLLGRIRGVDGLKTGHVADQWSMVATAKGRGGRIFVAVLGAPSQGARDRDAHCLLSVGRRLAAPASTRSIG